jgi:hypothetical protein
MSTLRYLYPKVVTRNYGDHVIDRAVRAMLSRRFRDPAAECNVREGSYPPGDFDCLIIPGITHLTAGACPALDRVGELPFPTYCMSGNVWQRPEASGILIRTRVIRPGGRAPAPDLRVARAMANPVGARDPFTYALLSRNGIEALYTGCATLMLPADGVADDGYVLMSFGRGFVRTQTRAGHALARRHHVIGICHEDGDEERYRAAGWRPPLVTYRGDVEMYLSYFKRASLVVTGRLHGALPALAYGKKVFCYGTRDSRTTLLDDLGVPIHSYAEVGAAPQRASAAFNRGLVEVFDRNWDRLCDAIERRQRLAAAPVRVARSGE